MAFLADDELHGRGSATRDEHIWPPSSPPAVSKPSALSLRRQQRQFSIQKSPLLPDSSFRQRVADRGILSLKRQILPKETWNAIAIMRGSSEPNEVILLTAHIDHLGVARETDTAGKQDLIYNGADDDASGTAAVLATRSHVLAHRSRLTGIDRHRQFPLFGSEEIGGYGNRAFLRTTHPSPLSTIVANLEFEMIGRPDPAAGKDPKTLFLTGYERSNLGPELAKHGAPLVKDPHPAEHFFERSDNIALARKGIIAHTVSSFGLHKDYHPALRRTPHHRLRPLHQRHRRYPKSIPSAGSAQLQLQAPMEPRRQTSSSRRQVRKMAPTLFREGAISFESN